MKSDKNIKVLITAGHAATTAFSLFEEIKEKRPEWQVLWVGAKKAIEGKNVVTLEHKIFSNLDIKSYFITAGRLQRRLSVWTVPSLLKTPIGFFQSLAILIREKPDIIVSFGGYVSFPVTVSGFLLGIPIIIHEQTSAAGLANKIEAKFATRVAISRESSFKLFPEKKTILVGNLVRKEITKIKPKLKIGNPPIVYMTGGSRGSQIMNQALEDCLKTLLKNYIVIHHTGDLDFERFKTLKENLDKKLAVNYFVKNSFDASEISDIFSKADIVVSRAGANTISEIVVTRKPSILIPIPWVQNNEQEKNAMMVETTGLARILNERDLNGESLANEINYIRNNWNAMSKNSLKNIEELDKNASHKLLHIIEEFLPNQEKAIK